jgi:tetratricopeptide (TPR) repeat protein/anti-sigma regulatory factor (Ser/Thr protein kinase)
MLSLMRKLILFLLVVVLHFNLYAQENCKCPEAQTLSNKRDSITKLTQLTSAFCKALGYELIADSLIKNKQTEEAEILLEKINGLYKKSGCAEKQQIKLYMLYAQVHDIRAEFKQLLEYYLKILAIAENSNDETETASTLLNIAQVFNRMKQADKGMEYTRRSVPVVQKMKPSPLKAELLNKITARYFFYSQDFQDKAHADTAGMFVNEAYSTAKEVKSIKDQIIALTRMSAIAESRNEYQKAFNYIDSALNLCKPGIHNRQYVTLFGDRGYLNFKLKNYKEARRFADSALKYSIDEKYPPLISNMYSLIYEIETAAGNYKDALWARDNQKKISDSLFTADRSKAVNELEKKYNQAKNEKTIKELSLQKQIYLLLAAALLLGIVAIAFFLRQQSLKHKQKILETEQRLNRARMNPHFFFNALASLQSFALEKNDGKAIAGNLSKFSGLMRETLESTYNDYVTIEQETDFLRHYLDLQLIRYPDKFSYTITADDELEQDELLVPSMIVQPFVENSIEHGFMGIDYKGRVDVHFSVKEKELHITITDDGKGFGKTNGEKSNHISRAGQIVKDRIYLLNLKLKTKASFTIDEGKDKGVVVKIILPEMYKR